MSEEDQSIEVGVTYKPSAGTTVKTRFGPVEFNADGNGLVRISSEEEMNMLKNMGWNPGDPARFDVAPEAPEKLPEPPAAPPAAETPAEPPAAESAPVAPPEAPPEAPVETAPEAAPAEAPMDDAPTPAPDKVETKPGKRNKGKK